MADVWLDHGYNDPTMKPNDLTRLHSKDATLWSDDPKIQARIAHRLGWLDVAKHFDGWIQSIHQARSTMDYTDLVVVGMGGSSLTAKVFASMVDTDINVWILDTTHPDTIQKCLDSIDPQNTIFLIASKSGTTLEVTSTHDVLWGAFPEASRYMVITDAGTPLEAVAQERGYAKVWTNPTDIGGRFSALSLFGLVPLGLMGADLHIWLGDWEKRVLPLWETDSPAWVLAQQMFSAHEEGVHRLCLQATDSLSSLASWIEQILAESLGKEGKGFLPFVQTHGVRPFDDSYVHAIGFEDELDTEMNVHSVSVFNQPQDIMEEFFLWEITTALLGSYLNINPFDEPHVVLSKQATNTLLEKTRSEVHEEIQSHATDFASWKAKLGQASPEDAHVLLCYTQPDQGIVGKMTQELRSRNIPWTLQYGPQYLHSTGQYHKDGRNNATYTLVMSSTMDLDIPEQSYTLEQVYLSQALGDFQALRKCGRKAQLLWSV